MTHHARAIAPFPTRTQSRPAIGLLTPHNPFDPRAFSGTVHYATRALTAETGLDIRLLCGHRPATFRDRLARRMGRTTAPALRPGDLDGLDAVIGLVASDLLDALPHDMPFFHVTDATPRHLAEAYGWDIPEMSYIREARVAGRAVACLYSSETVAARARTELAPGQALAVPFGVNMAHPPATLPVKPPLDRLELIFVGADWVRKGGDIAVEALARLRADGIDAHLTLVGGIPERLTSHPGVTVAGFLDKSRPRDADRLSALYAGAHAMVLPTRGDCTPMVIAEAMAHGAPVLVTDTGATTEMLGGAGAGRTLSLEAGPAEWARAIADLIHDPAAYDLMSDAAFDRARTRFSWETWASQVARIVSAEIAGLARAA